VNTTAASAKVGKHAMYMCSMVPGCELESELTPRCWCSALQEGAEDSVGAPASVQCKRWVLGLQTERSVAVLMPPVSVKRTTHSSEARGGTHNTRHLDWFTSAAPHLNSSSW
jgi:hypothetical protein